MAVGVARAAALAEIGVQVFQWARSTRFVHGVDTKVAIASCA